MDKDGYTALHHALARGGSDTALTLMRCKHKADATIAATDSTAPIHTAAGAGLSDVIKQMIKSAGQGSAFQTLADGKGDLALASAVGADDTACMAMLLSHGCDVKHKNTQGETVLHTAAMCGSAACLKELASNEAAKNIVNQVNSEGHSAYDCAVASADNVRPLCVVLICTHSYRISLLNVITDRQVCFYTQPSVMFCEW